MRPDWILVANATHARLLQKDAGAPVVVIDSFEHPASRARPSTLGDAPAGREASGHGFGGAAFERRTDAHRKELHVFAKELAQPLEAAALGGRFHRLFVFASSPFLGELREALGPAAHKLLAASHDADLTSYGLDELEGRMAPWGVPPA